MIKSNNKVLNFVLADIHQKYTLFSLIPNNGWYM